MYDTETKISIILKLSLYVIKVNSLMFLLIYFVIDTSVHQQIKSQNLVMIFTDLGDPLDNVSQTLLMGKKLRVTSYLDITNT